MLTNYLEKRIYIKNKNLLIIKYEILQHYGNQMIIRIDVFLFVTLYKKERPLMKIDYVFFLHSNFSFSFFSSSTLLFYNMLSAQHFEYVKKENNLSTNFLICMQPYFLQAKYEKQHAFYFIIIIFIYFISQQKTM